MSITLEVLRTYIKASHHSDGSLLWHESLTYCNYNNVRAIVLADLQRMRSGVSIDTTAYHFLESCIFEGGVSNEKSNFHCQRCNSYGSIENHGVIDSWLTIQSAVSRCQTNFQKTLRSCSWKCYCTGLWTKVYEMMHNTWKTRKHLAGESEEPFDYLSVGDPIPDKAAKLQNCIFWSELARIYSTSHRLPITKSNCALLTVNKSKAFIHFTTNN